MHLLATKQGKYCKGDCPFYKSSRPIGPAYITHVYCRVYEIWMLKKYAVNNELNCPCCTRRVRTKSSKSKDQLTRRYLVTRNALGMFKKFIIYGKVELR